MEIRAGRLDEVEVLEALQMRSSLVWEEDRESLLAHPEVIVLPVEAVREGRVRVATDSGAAIGFSVALPLAPGVVELDGLFVEPDRMRGGIGRALVDDVVARALDARAVRIEVTANLRAQRFYERCGFVGDDMVPTQFSDALRMHRDLA